MTRGGFGDEDHYNMLATPKRSKPAGEQPRVGKTAAPAHLVRISQGISDMLAMLREQVWMSIGNVLFPFVGQFHLGV